MLTFNTDENFYNLDLQYVRGFDDISTSWLTSLALWCRVTNQLEQLEGDRHQYHNPVNFVDRRDPDIRSYASPEQKVYAISSKQ